MRDQQSRYQKQALNPPGTKDGVDGLRDIRCFGETEEEGWNWEMGRGCRGGRGGQRRGEGSWAWAGRSVLGRQTIVLRVEESSERTGSTGARLRGRRVSSRFRRT